MVQMSDAPRHIFAVESFGYSPNFTADFLTSDAFLKDPRVPYFQAVPLGTVYYDHMLYDVAEIGRNRWVQESCEVLEVKYQLGSMFGLPSNVRAGVTLLRTEKEGHAPEDAVRAFQRLAPHIEQACKLGYVITREAGTRFALLDALARKADGVVLLDRGGCPIFMNDAAHNILIAGDGLSFSAGDFVAARAPETRRLQKMIGTVLRPHGQSDASPGGQVLISRISGKRPYVVSIMAAPPTERFLAKASINCIIHIQDLSFVHLPSIGSLHAVFGLTEREAALAIELVRSTSLEMAAMSAGMALNTARNHLQSIFRKTATNGQAEAIQLLGRLL
jgi:DNA-binding CsgD family transcriptional regulator